VFYCYGKNSEIYYVGMYFPHQDKVYNEMSRSRGSGRFRDVWQFVTAGGVTVYDSRGGVKGALRHVRSRNKTL